MVWLPGKFACFDAMVLSPFGGRANSSGRRGGLGRVARRIIAKEAAAFVTATAGKKPFFLYVPFNAVHAPHQVPDEYMKPYTALTGERKTYAKRDGDRPSYPKRDGDRKADLKIKLDGLIDLTRGDIIL